MMETLNFGQMEQVNGGGCGSAWRSLGISALGLLAAAAAIGTGPIGWIAGGGLLVSMLGIGSSGVDIMNDCAV